MNSEGLLSMSGDLNARLVRPKRTQSAASFRIPGLGRLIVTRDQGDANLLAKEVFGTNLAALHVRDGAVVDHRDLGSGLVTHAGVVLLASETATSAGAAPFNVLKYHGSGTGVTAATATDTALQTAIGTTATAGTNTNADASPNATITATATVSYSGSAAVTEWGLFNQATLAGATMWDHKVFGAFNVVAGDAIQFIYTLTLASGS